jgi:FkbM family methyltransferase
LFHKLFAQLGTDLVIDVGANRGQFVELLRAQFKYAGRVVSFEPTSAAFAALVASRTGDALWSGRREALGTATGTAEINVFGEDQFSSFFTPSSYGSSQWATLTRADHKETVTVRRLDEVWPEIVTTERSVFLKIDTQGRDLDILESGESVLPQVTGLLMEMPAQHIYEGTPSLPAVLDKVLSYGFDIAGMWPENVDPQMRVVEFNCLLRRS